MIPHLSNTHIELLMECHEAEILHLEPVLGLHYMKHVKRLVTYGLVEPRDYYKHGKKLYRFYITEMGIKYLEIILKQNRTGNLLNEEKINYNKADRKTA